MWISFLGLSRTLCSSRILTKVAKTITLDDLDEDDIEALESGSIRILPFPDTAGRKIIFICEKYAKYKSWKNEVRNLWYQMMIPLYNDEQVQKSGYVFVFYYVGVKVEDRPKDSSKTYSQTYLLRGIPSRQGSYHFCLNDIAMHTIIKCVCAIGGKDLRVRFRPHFGSHVECQYKLKSFGIPQHALPQDLESGRDTPTDLLSYLGEQVEIERRRIKEEEQEVELSGDYEEEGLTSPRRGKKKKKCVSENPKPRRKKLIAVATFKDVLLGRGKPYQIHPGNVYLNQAVLRLLSQYQKADKKEKKQISLDVIQEIQEKHGGRFLRRDTEINRDMWEEVSTALALEKVAHGFRTCAVPSASSPSTATASA